MEEIVQTKATVIWLPLFYANNMKSKTIIQILDTLKGIFLNIDNGYEPSWIGQRIETENC